MTTEVKYYDPDTGEFRSELLYEDEMLRVKNTIVEDYDTYAEVSNFVLPGIRERIENEKLPDRVARRFGLVFVEHWTE